MREVCRPILPDCASLHPGYAGYAGSPNPVQNIHCHSEVLDRVAPIHAAHYAKSLMRPTRATLA